MTAGVVLVQLGVAALAGALWAYLFRWFVRTYPLIARHRRLVRAILIALFALPFARLAQPLWPAARHLARVGSLPHLVLSTSALALLLARGASSTVAALTRSPESAPDRPPEDDRRRQTLSRLGGAALLGASTLLFGRGTLVGAFELEVCDLPLKLDRLPRRLSGFTIAQISDIHVGAFTSDERLAQVVDAVNALSPDAIVITGDIVDIDRRDIPRAARGLARLRARHGVFAIPGNHDHYAGVDEVVDALGRAGLTMLVNRGASLAGDAGLYLAGVDDLWARHGPGNGPDLAAALAARPHDAATILLAHQPRFFDEARTSRVDLQLSGHTHGGQIRLGVSPARLIVGPFVAGHYERDGRHIYVNRGIGTTGPPARVGAPPEITRVVLL